MSMLACPKRKQKVINLRAKNSAWSNDSNKFGQKMLEKMGWSAGKGLGAKENGIIEHVVARYKNDDRGLGFEDKNDEWTKHEDEFNALLANLSGAGEEKDTYNPASLETKSKKSKARVHYHKFTRGKDLSRYSKKDLANIFGKKTLDKEEVEESVIEDIQTSENFFTEKGSMEDYFKSKLAKLKNNSFVPKELEKEDNDRDFSFKGFSQGDDSRDTPKLEKINSFSFYKTGIPSVCTENLIDEYPSTDIPKKKKKKDKKNKHIEHEIQPCEPTSLEDKTSIKKRKNKKHKITSAEVESNVADQSCEETLEQTPEIVKKNKKIKKLLV